MEVFSMGKNVNRHFSRNFDNFDIFLIKITDLNANTSILACWKAKVTFRVIYLGGCVTFHKLNFRLIFKIKKISNFSQRELRPSVFQCDRLVQICLLSACPSFWSSNDTKLPKPWKTSLILSNMHATWRKRATFLWQTFIVSCSKRNIFIRKVDTVVWETVSFEI